MILGKDEAMAALLSRFTVVRHGTRGVKGWQSYLGSGALFVMTGIGLAEAGESIFSPGSVHVGELLGEGLPNAWSRPGTLTKGRNESRADLSPRDADEVEDDRDSNRPGIAGELW